MVAVKGIGSGMETEFCDRAPLVALIPTVITEVLVTTNMKRFSGSIANTAPAGKVGKVPANWVRVPEGRLIEYAEILPTKSSTYRNALFTTATLRVGVPLGILIAEPIMSPKLLSVLTEKTFMAVLAAYRKAAGDTC